MRVNAEAIYNELLIILHEVIETLPKPALVHWPALESALSGLYDSFDDLDGTAHSLILESTPVRPIIGHLVNVCMLSMLISRSLGKTKTEVVRLGAAGLFHDIGMLMVEEIARKPDSLTAEDLTTLRKHPVYGFKMADRLGGLPPDLMKQLREVIFTEHERMDGVGYPRGLREEEVSEAAGIIGLSDIYEALTHSRPSRPAYSPHAAMQIILKEEAPHFDGRIVKAFLEALGVFPPGTAVKLSTGARGVVFRPNPGRPTRPWVRIVADATGHILEEPQPVDLLDNPTLQVTEADIALA